MKEEANKTAIHIHMPQPQTYNSDKTDLKSSTHSYLQNQTTVAECI